MANKNYTVSLDQDLMEKFQKECREDNIKYSNKIENLIKLSLDGKFIDTKNVNEDLVKSGEIIERMIDTLNIAKNAVKGASEYAEEGGF